MKTIHLSKKLCRSEGDDDTLGGPPPSLGNPGMPTLGNQSITPAGFWRRFVAVLLDSFIIGIILMPISMLAVFLFGVSTPNFAGGEGLAAYFLFQGGVFVLRLVLSFFYFGWFYKNKGATPGKMVMNLKVVDAQSGAHLSYLTAFLRETVGKLISALPFLLGFWIVAFRDDKRTFHDLIFKTQVVHRKD